MDQDKTVAPPVLLGRLASAIQRRPGRDASAKDETFLIDMALEGALYAYKNGWRDREGLIAEVAGRIRIDGERRQEGARGFYSASANREAGQTIEQAIGSFSECFIDHAWSAAFKGRPPSAGDWRNFSAAYRWTFTRYCGEGQQPAEYSSRRSLTDQFIFEERIIMSVIDQLKPFLGDIAHLTDESSDGKTTYIHPKLRNLGSVSVVLIREIIAPTVFRNLEAEITDIAVGDRRFIRAVPNKFKHRERANGLKLLRHFGAGGSYPQNRHAMPDKDMPSSAFDLNSLVFGDFVNQWQQGPAGQGGRSLLRWAQLGGIRRLRRQDLSQSRRRGWDTVRRRQQGQFHQFV